MPRLKNEVNKIQVELLKNLAAQTFGKTLTHSFECELLSRDIKKVTSNYLSPQTLRRFFGFLPTDFSASVKTLDTLASYCGYSNWHAFTEQSSKGNYHPLTLDQEVSLYLDFYKIEIKEEADMNYHNAARNIAFRILFNPALLFKLSPLLAKNPVSQIYFFERFPFIDGLCTEYQRSIRLYLQKKNAEAQIFGNCLLFLSAFLGNNPKEFKPLINRIGKYSLDQSLHPFIIARYIGSHILFEQSRNGNKQHWLSEANKWNKFFQQKESIRFWRYPFFQHMMSDYLNLAGLYNESYAIIRTIRHSDNNYEIEKGYVEALEVIYHIARHALSAEEYIKWFENTKVFDTINPIFQRYYQLQALHIYISLLPENKKRAKATEWKRALIKETGFTFFQNIES